MTTGLKKVVGSIPPLVRRYELQEPVFTPTTGEKPEAPRDSKVNADHLAYVLKTPFPDAAAATKRAPKAEGLTLRRYIDSSKIRTASPKLGNPQKEMDQIGRGLLRLEPQVASVEKSNKVPLRTFHPVPHHGTLELRTTVLNGVIGNFAAGYQKDWLMYPKQLSTRLQVDAYPQGNLSTFYQVNQKTRSVVRLIDGNDDNVSGARGRVGNGSRIFFGPEGSLGTRAELKEGQDLTLVKDESGKFRLQAEVGKAHVYNGLRFTRKDGIFHYASPARNPDSDPRKKTGDDVARLLTDLKQDYRDHVFHMNAAVSEHPSRAVARKESHKTKAPALTASQLVALKDIDKGV